MSDGMEPRHQTFEMDRQYAESGGFKSWGGFALMLIALVLLLLFVIVRAVLIMYLSETGAGWGAWASIAIVLFIWAFMCWRRRKPKSKDAYDV